MSANRRNAFIKAGVAFANWCIETHRLVANPFAPMNTPMPRATPGVNGDR